MVVANKLVLGSRTIGYTVYDVELGEQILASEKEIRDALTEGKVIRGFHLTADEKGVELDEGVNICKVAGLSISPLLPVNGLVTEILTCIGRAENGDIVVINSRFGRKVLDKAKIESLLELGGCINGINRNGKGVISSWLDEPEQSKKADADDKKK